MRARLYNKAGEFLVDIELAGLRNEELTERPVLLRIACNVSQTRYFIRRTDDIYDEITHGFHFVWGYVEFPDDR